MPRPVVVPKIHTTRTENFSLTDMQKRLQEKPSKVRVGLPDNVNSEEEKAILAKRRKFRRAEPPKP